MTDLPSVPTPRRTRPGGWSSHDVVTVSALGLLVGLGYFPALQGGFVWDDVIFAEEPVIHRWSGLWSIWFSPADIENEGHYWPIVYTSFWLEHKLWGLAPAGYHAVNLLLHWVNSLLVWRLLSRLAVPGAWAVAAVFAVHPLHVESVAWIIERKDLLSALLYLTAVLTWIRFVETPARPRYCLALALFTVGLLSKSVVVTLPVALLIWHGWQRERVTSTDLLRLAPFFVVGLAVTLADYSFYSSREPLDLGYSFIERVLIASRASWFYVGKLLWPVDLAVIYPLWDIRSTDPLAWLFAVGAAALVALLWLGRRRMGRGPLAAVLFYAVTLSPVLGFVDYGYMQFAFVADRFQYLAGIGVMAVLLGAAAHGASRLPAASRMPARAALAVILALLGTLTWNQSRIYRDEVAFFSHIVSLNPAARDAYLNLGSALFAAGRFDEGLAASRLALEHRPDSVGALANMGRGLLKLGQLDEAERHLRRALEIDRRSTVARQNLAEVLRKRARYPEALEAYRAVLRKDPENALAYAGMGTVLFEMQRYDKAVAAMKRGLSLGAAGSVALSLHLFSGRALEALDRFDAAEKHFLSAAEIDPRNPAPLVDLAGLRMAQRRFEEAGEHLRRARELSRGPADLHAMAEVVRQRGRLERAMGLYRAAIGTDPDFAPAHAGLGIALFRAERRAEAVEAMARALRLQPDLPVASALHVFIGRAHQSLGRPGAAVKSYELAVDADPRNTDALDRLAALHFGQKRYRKALGLYRRLAELMPSGAQTHANLAATHYYLGRPGEALRSFERALSLDPDLQMAKSGAEHMRRILKQARGRATSGGAE